MARSKPTLIKMKNVVFFGTPDYVIPVLEALKSSGYEIAAAVTQPPKPVGRKQALTPSPVTLWAGANHIPAITNVKEAANIKADLGVVAAYGKIIPFQVLGAFPNGLVNIHPSLLPKHRGASPIPAAIIQEEKYTGITIMKVDEEMDHGPILVQSIEEIKDNDTLGSLRERLFKKSAEILVKTLPSYLEGKLKPQEQDHTQATYTTLLKKEHGFIPPKYIQAAVQGDPLNKVWPIPFIKNQSVILNSYSLARFVRALDPWPGAWTLLRLKASEGQAQRLKILRAHIEELVPNTQCLVLDLVQLEGKGPVSWEQFKKGYPEAKF